MSNENNDIVRPFYYVDENGKKLEEDKGEIIKPIIHLDEKKEKGPEEKSYLILYCFYDEESGDEVRSFEFVIGRTETRKRIIEDVMVGDVNVHKSRVLVEGAPLEDSISVYSFMKLMEGYFEDDNSFNIEDFNYDDDNTTNGMELDINQYIEKNNKQEVEYEQLDMFNQENLLGITPNDDEDDVNV